MKAEPLPESMKHLRIDPVRQIVVPWFVPWIDGKPEFRMAHAEKLHTAVNQNRCWVCGQRHEPHSVTYVVGPMCGVNRVSAEPPSHLDCARYSARNCPFLAKPHMVRRDEEKIAAKGDCAGMMISRNPGVTLLWTAAPPLQTFSDGNSGMLFRLPEPLTLEFFAEGRSATAAELIHSIDTGLPILIDAAREDGPAAVEALRRMVRRFEELLEKMGPAITT